MTAYLSTSGMDLCIMVLADAPSLIPELGITS